MANNDNTVKNKVSNHIQHQLPEFIQADHPVFSQFVKLYYQFLESAEVTFSEINNYLREETESVNFVLDENGDQIVLEDSEIKFEIGETVTGQTSGATAKVLVDDIDDNKINELPQIINEQKEDELTEEIDNSRRKRRRSSASIE